MVQILPPLLPGFARCNVMSEMACFYTTNEEPFAYDHTIDLEMIAKCLGLLACMFKEFPIYYTYQNSIRYRLPQLECEPISSISSKKLRYLDI